MPDNMMKKCPYCSSTVFHVAYFVRIVNGQDEEVYRQYRCPIDNATFEAHQLEDVAPLGDGYKTLITEGAASIAGQVMSTEEFLKDDKK